MRSNVAELFFRLVRRRNPIAGKKKTGRLPHYIIGVGGGEAGHIDGLFLQVSKLYLEPGGLPDPGPGSDEVEQAAVMHRRQSHEVS